MYEGWRDGYDVGYCAENDCDEDRLYVKDGLVGIKVYQDWYGG